MEEGLFLFMFRPVAVQWLKTDAKLSNGTLYKLTTCVWLNQFEQLKYQVMSNKAI